MKNYYFLLFVCIGLFSTCKTAQETTSPKSNKKEITGPFVVYGISNVTYTYNASTFTYTFTVPSSTNITSLRVMFLISDKATISPDQNVARDYTNPVVYTVTAEDGSKQDYTVRVVQQGAPKSTEKLITAFSFDAIGITASISQPNRTVTASVDANYDITKLVPTITLSPKASISPGSGIAQNFTNAVNYVVTAEDGSTQTYTVQVTKKATSFPTSYGCLVTRIEASDPNEFCTFNYDNLGRITLVSMFSGIGPTSNILKSTLKCTYNGSTNELTEANINGDYLYKFSYENGRLKDFPTMSVSSGTIYSNAVTFNNDNQITQLHRTIGVTASIYCEKFVYQNGALITRKNCFPSNDKKEDIAMMEYDNTKSLLYSQRANPAFLIAFNDFIGDFDFNALRRSKETSTLNSPFLNLFGYYIPKKIGYVTTVVTSTGFYGISNAEFEKNSNGYPTAMKFVYTAGPSSAFPTSYQFTYKIIYGGCQ